MCKFSFIGLVCHLCRAQLILCRLLMLCKCKLIFRMSHTGIMLQKLLFSIWMSCWETGWLEKHISWQLPGFLYVFLSSIHSYVNTRYGKRLIFPWVAPWLSVGSLKKLRAWKVDTLFTLSCLHVIILPNPWNSGEISCVIPVSRTLEKNNLCAQENTCNDEVCCAQVCCAGHIFKGDS